MPSPQRAFGDAGEEAAARYLQKHGYEEIERNYQKKWGEVDLIFKKGELLVFCEVKTRDAIYIDRYLAEYAVNRAKIKKLQGICEMYLLEREYPDDQEWRIDVISVSIDKILKKATIKHIENAVWEAPY